MAYLFTFFTALVVSMAIIPLMMRLAPYVGMLDQPDARKVHTAPIPRAGGAGIVLGALIPVFMWLKLDESIIGYLFGSLVLLVFGLWDDARTLGHHIKFVGQIIAAVAVVYYGDIYIATLPFTDLTPVPTYFAKPFTVFAIVGMINALNVSDGLDGLAGGLFVLSVSAIAYLASQADGVTAIVIAAATLGGVLGFLRYNTHPARVFMGDGGSQFLGFTLAFLALFLTQKVNSAVSPALPLLFLGLPIIDLLAAVAQRIYHGISPFVATRHHIHHHLLELGFHHYEAVIIIYSIQMLFILSAILLCYESDTLILSLYLGACTAIFLFLAWAKRNKWQAHRAPGKSRIATTVERLKQHWFFINGTTRIVATVIPLIFLGTSVMASDVPRDFGLSASVLAAILALLLIIRTKEPMALRAISYVTAAFVVYIETKYLGSTSTILFGIDVALYMLLGISIWLAVRYASDDEFKVSPMDFLVIFIVMVVGIISRDHFHEELLGVMAVKLAVLFYGCEIIYAKLTSKWNSLNIVTLITLSLLGAKSLA
jgi:UDP-GlcNAc:undecaprenyl-phosphate GlcNAc-1-phosphate transferase